MQVCEDLVEAGLLGEGLLGRWVGSLRGHVLNGGDCEEKRLSSNGLDLGRFSSLLIAEIITDCHHCIPLADSHNYCRKLLLDSRQIVPVILIRLEIVRNQLILFEHKFGVERL